MPPPPETLADVLHRADASLDVSRKRLFELLRIPSISAQPDHRRDCERAAEWIRDQLISLGFRADVRPTAGQPIVVGHHASPPGYRGPHVLFYGHYDVQPPDPLELWHSPPFDPQLFDGPHGKRFVARGAVDDKGQVMMFLEALRAWKEAVGGIPAQITALIEGEEEVGSPSLQPFLVANKTQLAADLALISDTLMWDIDTPAITSRLGGLAQAQVTLKGANRDLHPGLYGGSALNAIEALARLLADLHDADGRVQLHGFYDKVRPISSAQRAQWDSLAFDEGSFLGKVGLQTVTGERGYPALERMWARPSADINGMWGGYTGPGSKTVIAAEASAKISFRLVPDQDPDEVFEQFQRFAADRLPPDARVEIASRAGTPAIEMNLNSPWVRAAQTILGEEYDKPAVLKGTGGSIPAVVLLRNVLGIDSLLMGFALDDDGAHSPNEKFEQRCFHHGIRSHVRLLAKFARG